MRRFWLLFAIACFPFAVLNGYVAAEIVWAAGDAWLGWLTLGAYVLAGGLIVNMEWRGQ